MPKWKDKKKSWQDSEIVSSEVKFGRFKLAVHRHINYPPDVWLASAYDLFSQAEMDSKNLDEAKFQAKEKVKEIIAKAMRELEE